MLKGIEYIDFEVFSKQNLVDLAPEYVTAQDGKVLFKVSKDKMISIKPMLFDRSDRTRYKVLAYQIEGENLVEKQKEMYSSREHMQEMMRTLLDMYY